MTPVSLGSARTERSILAILGARASHNYKVLCEKAKGLGRIYWVGVMQLLILPPSVLRIRNRDCLSLGHPSMHKAISLGLDAIGYKDFNAR